MHCTNPLAKTILTKTHYIPFNPIDLPSFHTPSTLKIIRINKINFTYVRLAEWKKLNQLLWTLKENTKIHYKNKDTLQEHWIEFEWVNLICFYFFIFNIWYIMVFNYYFNYLSINFEEIFECTLFISFSEFKKATLEILLAKVKLFIGKYL